MAIAIFQRPESHASWTVEWKGSKPICHLQAIAESLKLCKSLDELNARLSKRGIEALYKYKSGTKDLIGISFKISEHKYKGSEIDRKFSLKNLERTIQHQQKIESHRSQNLLAKTNYWKSFMKEQIKNNTRKIHCWTIY